MSTGNVERSGPETPSGTQATARQRIEEEARAAQRQAEGTTGRVQEQAKDITQEAGQRAKSQISEQKTRAASNLSALANALQHSSHELREQEHGTFAGVTDRAADQIVRLSDSLQNKSVDELMHDAERYARRQPGVFLGAAFLAGLLASRFLKASSTRQRTEDMGRTDMGYSEAYGASTYGTGATGYGRGTTGYGTTTPRSTVSQYPAPDED